MHSLGRRIRAVRQAHNLYQMDFAKKLGVPQSAVSRWETDDLTPSDENLHSILELAMEKDTGAFKWKTIADLRYGVARTDSGEDVTYLFDLDELAEIGRKIATLGHEDWRSRSKGVVDFGTYGRTIIAIKTTDDSMSSVAPKGSTVLVNMDDTSLDDAAYGVFLVRENGKKKAVFRVLRTLGPLRLEPTNVSANADTIFLDQDPIVLGRAITVVAELPIKAV